MKGTLLSAVVVLVLLAGVSGCAPSAGGPGAWAGKARLESLGNGVCRDRVTGLMWQQGRSGKFASLAEAVGYAQGLVLGGYDDWRLPTNDELYTLHDLLAAKLAGDCVIDEKGRGYWSAVSESRGEVGFWETYPMCGGVDYVFRKLRSGVVRAVRP